MQLDTDRGPAVARMLVAADGLSSPLRCKEELDVPPRGEPRFGLRRHFRRAPWSRSIEIHLAKDVEAYITPVSPDCIGVAFLWSESNRERRSLERAPKAGSDGLSRGRWDALLQRFPVLGARLNGALPCSRIRGAGPLERASSARTRHRFALVGDAAGYVDAITGEGISLSLLSSMCLAHVLPDALCRGATRAALAPYERDFARLFGRYAVATRGVLAVVRRPRLRRSVLRTFHRFPGSFDWLIGHVVDG
jgi:menaquinone-9 beta-reductase